MSLYSLSLSLSLSLSVCVCECVCVCVYECVCVCACTYVEDIVQCWVSSPAARHLSVREANHLLCGLLLTGLFLSFPVSNCFLPPGCLIPGSLSGHLQTSTLSNHHEPKDVLSPCYCVLSFGIPLHGWSSCDAFPVILLWPQCYSSLFL